MLNFSKNKIQLFHDLLEILNQSKNSFYEKIDVKNNIKNFIMKNSNKDFKIQKFEFIPFKIDNINKTLSFSNIKEKENPKNPINQEKVIELVKQYFIENKIVEIDSEYISKTLNSLKKYSIEFNIKYNSLLDQEKEEKNLENKNLITDLVNVEENNNIINNNEKKKEIFDNIKYIENFMSKFLMEKKVLKKN